MLIKKGCPQCGGDLSKPDKEGDLYKCLACSREWSLDKLEELRKRAQVGRPKKKDAKAKAVEKRARQLSLKKVEVLEKQLEWYKGYRQAVLDQAGKGG